MGAIARGRAGARDVGEARVVGWEDAGEIGACRGARGEARRGACATHERRMWIFMLDEFLMGARRATDDARALEQVKWFNISKGFGFIVPDDGSEEIFVHQTALHSEGFRSLKEVRAKRARANFECFSERRRNDANAERVLTARMF